MRVGILHFTANTMTVECLDYKTCVISIKGKRAGFLCEESWKTDKVKRGKHMRESFAGIYPMTAGGDTKIQGQIRTTEILKMQIHPQIHQQINTLLLHHRDLVLT